MSFLCGIDFGTSNSAISVRRSDKPVSAAQLIPLEEDRVTLPSALFFPEMQKSPSYGRAAIQAFLEHEDGRFMRSLKRVLGTPLMEQGTRLHGKQTSFQDIIARYIQHIKTRAEASIGQELTHVTLGRPVHFQDNDPSADQRAESQLREIASQCGFTHIDFQYEPVAAAYAHKQKLTSETLAFVADIGGGTSDFSILRLRPSGEDTILANSGVRVGGNDLDKQLSLASFMPLMGLGTTYGTKHLMAPKRPFYDISEWSLVNFLYTHETRKQLTDILRQSHDQESFGRIVKLIHEELGHQLLQSVEDAKIALSTHKDTTTSLSFVEADLNVTTTRDVFENSTRSVQDAMTKSAHDCLRQAEVAARDIALLIFTGGSTEIPVVQNCFKTLFPEAKISQGNKLSSVALGLVSQRT